ncbi:2-keto-3-deoxy-L-rhamnonate aldolase [Rubripirellula amarantea]|uniref:2-keto-3-deoxy-L-rhamnonate aldolase n=1 Tax=Rubripirellula amarantea TaxID=2527999 RepID=A0A5C5WM30_9BACT|nr:aldolase/citrate lyase family protein [Rubripirellula amarantea]TWT51225.1 2-keto-3-deoxy-L-rhamnonate aldolase [Rubripirellula amarantea]
MNHPKNFRDRFRDGDSLGGFQLTSMSPHWPKFLKGKIDFIFIDCEHHCFSRDQVAWLCTAYRAAGIAPVVRILEPRAALVRAAIDDGAEAVVVPYVESVDQVREIAAAAKLRPIQGERAASAMRGNPLDHEMQVVSDRHCGDVGLILQIESETAVDRCTDLIEVHGVDGVLVGPFDLTATLGCLNDHSNPIFIQLAKKVAHECRSAGLGAGIYFAESPEKERKAGEWGYNLLVHGCDWSLIGEALSLRQPSGSR